MKSIKFGGKIAVRYTHYRTIVCYLNWSAIRITYREYFFSALDIGPAYCQRCSVPNRSIQLNNRVIRTVTVNRIIFASAAGTKKIIIRILSSLCKNFFTAINIIRREVHIGILVITENKQQIATGFLLWFAHSFIRPKGMPGHQNKIVAYQSTRA